MKSSSSRKLNSSSTASTSSTLSSTSFTQPNQYYHESLFDFNFPTATTNPPPHWLLLSANGSDHCPNWSITPHSTPPLITHINKQSDKSTTNIHNSESTKSSSNCSKTHKTVLLLIIGLYIQLITKLMNGPGGGTMAVYGQQQQSGKCGDLKLCSAMFRQATLSHNLSYDLSHEKIEEMCIKLSKAVKCFNNYRKSCMSENFHHSSSFYDQMSEGPLGLTMELCNNPKFKQDYLTLGPCQKRYRGEFDRCLRVTHSHSTSTDTNGQNGQNGQNGHNGNNGNGVHHTENGNGNGDGHYNTNGNGVNHSNQTTLLERFIEHCCALHNYHNCIYDISLDKCGKDAAEFSLKILELFNRGYLRDCAKYANLEHLCNRNSYLASSSSSVAILDYGSSRNYLLPTMLITALLILLHYHIGQLCTF